MGLSLRDQLRHEVAGYRASTFADTTKKAYQTHLRTYLNFCEKLKIKPVPVCEKTVAQYAAFLARTLQPSSVTQYLNIVRLLHLECGEVHPYHDSWLVKSTLKGIERVKGCPVRRKTPITPMVLKDIKSKLNFTDTMDCVFWAAVVVMFFGLLRRSNLFQDGSAFDPDKQLTRDCFIMRDCGAVNILVRWSKTIQRREKTYVIALPALQNHPLCPVSAVVRMFKALGPAHPKAKAFPMRGSDFNRRLRQLTSAAEGDYSSHSLRRGGATWALSCGVPGEVVKCLGDWKSTAYLTYLDQIPQTVQDHYRTVLIQEIPLY